MYDIRVALRRFRHLIKWVAWHYSVDIPTPGRFKMTYEDLEAEGLLCLVECCQRFPKSERRFARYFKRSLYNRIKKLARFSRAGKRQGEEVSITLPRDDEEKFFVPNELKVLPPADTESKEFRGRMEKRIERLIPYLSDDAVRLLKILTHPKGEEVLHEAWMDWCRKHKLRSQGIGNPNVGKFRVKSIHIRRALKMSSIRVSNAVSEIRHVDSVITRQQRRTTSGKS